MRIKIAATSLAFAAALTAGCTSNSTPVRAADAPAPGETSRFLPQLADVTSDWDPLHVDRRKEYEVNQAVRRGEHIVIAQPEMSDGFADATRCSIPSIREQDPLLDEACRAAGFAG